MKLLLLSFGAGVLIDVCGITGDGFTSSVLQDMGHLAPYGI
jgi:hypothetical protein